MCLSHRLQPLMEKAVISLSAKTMLCWTSHMFSKVLKQDSRAQKSHEVAISAWYDITKSADQRVYHRIFYYSFPNNVINCFQFLEEVKLMPTRNMTLSVFQ